MIHSALGTHPWRKSTKPPPVELRVVCHSFTQSLIIQRKIFDLLPGGVLHPDCTFHPSRGFKHREVLFACGSRIVIVTTRQSRLALASATLDGIWIDEPPPAETYAECVSRLVQTGGWLMLTLTPVGEPLGWLRREVERPDGVISETHFGLSVVNCPWMTLQQVQEAIDNCLGSQRPQVIYAMWDGVTPDRFIDGFSEACVVDELPPGLAGEAGLEVEVLLGQDHGDRPGAEVCVLLLRWTRKGIPHGFVWDEYVSPGATTEAQDAAEINAMLERHGLSLYSVDKARGDINRAGNSKGRRFVNEVFEEAFGHLAGGRCPFNIEKPRKGAGSILRNAKVVNGAFLDGRLHVHSRCKVLIAALLHWRGQDDEHKHAFDALGYIAYDTLDPSRSSGPSIAIW